MFFNAIYGKLCYSAIVFKVDWKAYNLHRQQQQQQRPPSSDSSTVHHHNNSNGKSNTEYDLNHSHSTNRIDFDDDEITEVDDTNDDGYITKKKILYFLHPYNNDNHQRSSTSRQSFWTLPSLPAAQTFFDHNHLNDVLHHHLPPSSPPPSSSSVISDRSDYGGHDGYGQAVKSIHIHSTPPQSYYPPYISNKKDIDYLPLLAALIPLLLIPLIMAFLTQVLTLLAIMQNTMNNMNNNNNNNNNDNRFQAAAAYGALGRRRRRRKRSVNINDNLIDFFVYIESYQNYHHYHQQQQQQQLQQTIRLLSMAIDKYLDYS